MRKRYKILRGEIVLGYVGFDDQSPCQPFEPEAAYFEIQELFVREHELTMLAAEADKRGEEGSFDRHLNEADNVMQEIVGPGVRFEALESNLCSFSCDELAIFDGRVCWR